MSYPRSIEGHPLGIRRSQQGRRATLLLVLVGLGGLAGAGVAQDLPVASLGARVRLTLQDSQARRVIGQLTAFGTDSVTVMGKRAKDLRVLPRSGIGRVELSTGREPRILRGMARGAGVGVVAGAVAVLVLAVAVPPCTDQSGLFEWCGSFDAGRLVPALGLVAAAGALEGLREAVMHPDDVWAPARWAAGMPTPVVSTRTRPLIGIGTLGGSRVLLVGFSLSR